MAIDPAFRSELEARGAGACPHLVACGPVNRRSPVAFNGWWHRMF
jgi:hypothetical protein